MSWRVSIEALDRANVIFVVENGEISQSGTHEELMRNDGLYAHLYDLQFREGESLAAESREPIANS